MDEANDFGTGKFPFESKEFTDEASVQYDKVYCKKAHALRAETINLFLHPSWEEVHIQKCIDSFKALIEKHLK